ncbi:phage tail tube assembly chaperone, partial [Oenococcus oeni]
MPVFLYINLGEIMKITVKEFQSQPFEVKTSNRNVQKALKIQLKMNEADDIA